MRAALPRFLDPLRHPAYRRFAAGNAVSLVTGWSQRIAIGWTMWELTLSATWVGALAMAELLPMVVIAPFAGAMADRVPLLRIMRLTQILLGVQAALLVGVMVAGLVSPGLLLGIVLLGGIVQATDHPFRLSLVPALVPAGRMASALALNSMVFNTARFVGPMLAAAMLAGWGPELACASHTLGALWFFAMLSGLTEPERAAPAARRGVLAMIREGWRYAVDHPGLRLMLMLSATMALLVRPLADLLPAYAALFQNDARLFATMSALVGLGAVSGGLVVSRMTTPGQLMRLALGSGAGMAALLIALALIQHRMLALVVLAASGFLMVISMISNLGFMQMVAEPGLRGRVVSLHTVIYRGGPALGAFAIGLLSDILGLRPVLLGAGAIALAASVVFILRRGAGLGSVE